MRGPFGILDQRGATDEHLTRLWVDDVARSLTRDPGAWLRQVDAEGGDAARMSKDEAWSLLAWVETAASVIVAARRPDLVTACGFALALLGAGPIDRRDVMVVASVVRRACVLVGADFVALAGEGAGRAGELGGRALPWLSTVSPDLPPTHAELGEGAAFTFRRMPSTFDPAALERRLLAQQRASRERGKGAS